MLRRISLGSSIRIPTPFLTSAVNVSSRHLIVKKLQVHKERSSLMSVEDGNLMILVSVSASLLFDSYFFPLFLIDCSDLCICFLSWCGVYAFGVVIFQGGSKLQWLEGSGRGSRITAFLPRARHVKGHGRTLGL